MLYVFLVLLGGLGAAVYILLIYREVPGAVEERLGQLQALPEDLGVWKTDDASEDAKRAAERGLLREVRLLHEPSKRLFASEKFIRQVRYRDRATRKIERVEPDEVLKRRRERGSKKG